jgi:hypothetical protein
MYNGVKTQNCLQERAKPEPPIAPDTSRIELVANPPWSGFPTVKNPPIRGTFWVELLIGVGGLSAQFEE